MLRHTKAGDIGAIRAELAIVLILDASLCVTLRFSAKANRVAAVLLMPYFLWLCYASALNAAMHHYQEKNTGQL
jgi:tryptophan-rich sensory protein